MFDEDTHATTLESAYQRTVQLELVRNVCLKQQGSRWTLMFGNKEIHFDLPAGSISAIFESLAVGACTLGKVAIALKDSATGALLERQLNRLWEAGLMHMALMSKGETVALLCNSGKAIVPMEIEDDCLGDYDWAPTSFVHKDKGWLRFETAENGSVVKVKESLYNLVATIFACNSSGTPKAETIQSDDGSSRVLHAWLIKTQFLLRAETTSGQVARKNSLTFADKLIHARSRRGRHIDGYGAASNIGVNAPIPAAVIVGNRAEQFVLPRPNLQEISRSDLPLTAAIEGRRSHRIHGFIAISMDELGEFLYRTVRTRCVDRSGNYEVALRPYPSGGALYAVDVYAVINRANGLPRGFHRYDPVEHCLAKIADFDTHSRALIDEAITTAGAVTPQILLLLSARFDRVAWKYSSIAYTLVLKEVGIIYQTMYLVATAMGLAACALGGGSASLFETITGKDYWQESCVGEFLLGTRDTRGAETDKSH